jgi:DNA-binding transcriptional ArsR family regulator
MMDVVNLLLHPVRLRIVHALSGGAELTTSQLLEQIPDVSKVTMYRHISTLYDAGFLDVTGEHRVRGAVERQYRLRQDRPTIDSDAAGKMSAQEHRMGFASAMAVLIAEFNLYLDREGSDPLADGVSYRQGILWLTRDELAAVTGELLDVLRMPLTNLPAPDRLPYLLSPVIFPTASGETGSDE